MNGPLPKLTARQRKSVNALIKKECCNYYEGNCLLLDDGETNCCPQMITYSLWCQYFRRSVLPLQPELEDEIINSKKLSAKCVNCGMAFKKNSNSHKYCNRCASLIRKEQVLKAVNKHNFLSK